MNQVPYDPRMRTVNTLVLSVSTPRPLARARAFVRIISGETMIPALPISSFRRRGGPQWESLEPLGKIVAMVFNKDRVMVATEEGVYEQRPDGYFHPVKFLRDDHVGQVVQGDRHG